MKIIEYSGRGIALADQDCERLARAFLSNEDAHTIAVSNSLFITAVRVFICEGLVPHTEVQFLYRGETLIPNRDGRMEEWPRGFCDYETDLLMRLLRGRST
jgi:hypothetical protein